MTVFTVKRGIMLVLLSPAKKLLNFDKPYSGKTTKPVFQKKANELIAVMKDLSVSSIAKLMHISNDLAELNYQRYHSFCRENCPVSQGYPAVYLFQGDVYRALQVNTWDHAALEFADSHLAILSGLYGLLKPLDFIQPYRLEMGTRLATAYGKSLYDFWQTDISHELNKQLASQRTPILINLASEEYFKAVDTSRLKFPQLTIHFREKNNNQLKVIGIYAKKARGAMAKYLMQQQIDDVDAIKQISILNYRFCKKSSDSQHFNFVRNAD